MSEEEPKFKILEVTVNKDGYLRVIDGTEPIPKGAVITNIKIFIE